MALALLAVVSWSFKPQTATRPQQAFGATNNPDFVSNYISVNGVTTWTLRQNMNVATTTLCSFPNPAGAATSTFVGSGVNVGTATSTLVSLTANFTTGTGTAAFIDMATSTSQFATSTPAYAYGLSIPASATPTFKYQGTGAGDATSSDVRLVSSLSSNDENLIRPSEIVNVKTSTAGLGGYTYGGQCIAVFQSVSAI